MLSVCLQCPAFYCGKKEIFMVYCFKSVFAEGIVMLQTIRARLFSLRDEEYAAFQAKLLPGIDRDKILGVRTPALRALAKELDKTGGASPFLDALPHEYFEENQLHAFLISLIKDFDECVRALDRFLPCVDNWATCDQMSPAVFAKNRLRLLPHTDRWLLSPNPYGVRFAVGMLLRHFLDEEFDPSQLETVSRVNCGEYYVSTMVAWYFATALAKQYEAALPFLENRALDPKTHERAIRKALESFRIPEERKAHLRTLGGKDRG